MVLTRHSRGEDDNDPPAKKMKEVRLFLAAHLNHSLGLDRQLIYYNYYVSQVFNRLSRAELQ